MANITPAQHLEEVLDRYRDSPNPRLAEITTAAIRHLHAFVEEVSLTREEWFTGIKTLTAIGQLCDEKRQEFILLSDTLGVSMLVEMINQAGAEGTTEPTVFGPFHVDDAPRCAMGESIVIDPSDADRPLVLTGRILDLDGQPIGGAELDVWQTASDGTYDVQSDDQTPMNMRGVFTTGLDGRYEIHSVRPVAYPIPGDGPAGALLFANGRHNWRPGHVHFVVSAPGYKSVITHLFDAESEYLDSDAVFGVRESLIIDMSDGTCDFDFVLEPET
ncbi:MAG: 6-chlorohydroxyquinol-1,2-dioxygenase [Acidimicrobiia bacterium]|nr:6-chlorohydroxyquinol-1,2-dioxygenase [Acidimicrobiia bacterium]